MQPRFYRPPTTSNRTCNFWTRPATARPVPLALRRLVNGPKSTISLFSRTKSGGGPPRKRLRPHPLWMSSKRFLASAIALEALCWACARRGSGAQSSNPAKGAGQVKQRWEAGKPGAIGVGQVRGGRGGQAQQRCKKM